MKWHRTPQQQAQQAPADPNEAFDAFNLTADQRLAYKNRRWSAIIPPFSPGPTEAAGTLTGATQGTPSDALPRLEGGFPPGMQITQVGGGYEVWWSPTAAQSSPAGTPYSFSVRYVDQRTGVVRDDSGVKGFNITAFSELQVRATISADQSDIDAVGDEYVVRINVNWLDPNDLPAYRGYMQVQPLLIGTLAFDLAQQTRPQLEQILRYEPGDVRIVDLRSAQVDTGLPERFRIEVLYVDYDIDNFRSRVSSKTLWFIGEVDQAHTKVTRIPIEEPQLRYPVSATAAFNGELIVDINSNLYAINPEGGVPEFRAGIYGNVDAMVAFTGSDGNEYLIASTERAGNRRLTWYRRGFGDRLGQSNPGIWHQRSYTADDNGTTRKPRGFANDGTTIWSIDDVNLWRAEIADIGATTITTTEWADTTEAALDTRFGNDVPNAATIASATWASAFTLTANVDFPYILIRIPIGDKPNIANYRLQVGAGISHSMLWAHLSDDATWAYYYYFTIGIRAGTRLQMQKQESTSTPGPPSFPPHEVTFTLVGAHGITNPTALLFKHGELLCEAGDDIYVINTVAGQRVGAPVNTLEVQVRGLTELEQRTYGYSAEGAVKIAAFDVDAVPEAPTGLSLSNVNQVL